MSAESANDWQPLEDLLLDWSQQACVNRAKSAKKAKRFRKLHYWLGIPVVIFSSCAGSAAFTQIHSSPNDAIRITAGILGILSAILAGLQTFFGFSESAEKYRAVGVGYEKIEKEIEEILALPVHLREALPKIIDDLRERMNALADDSPDIPDHTHSLKADKTRKQHSQDE